MSVSEWMKGELDGKVFYNPAGWMNCEWNGDFFYELSKLGDIGCLKFCMEYGLISKRYECPKCGKDMKLVNNDRWAWACRKSGGANQHYIKRSLKKGTWFQNSAMSFGLILRLTYMWLNKMPTDSIMNDLGVANQTVTEWKRNCREICIGSCLKFDGQVGGNGKTIDIYEAWLGDQKSKVERHVKGSSVFVGVVRNMNNCFVEVVEDRSAEILAEVLVKRVASGSTIIISSGTMYTSSRLLFEQLEAVHNVTITDKLKSSDGIWSVVKKALKGNEFLDGEFNGEVAEYIWRRQNNYLITPKVQNFLKAISESFTLKSKD